jgi:hypothetical protein
VTPVEPTETLLIRTLPALVTPTAFGENPGAMPMVSVDGDKPTEQAAAQEVNTIRKAHALLV